MSASAVEKSNPESGLQECSPELRFPTARTMADAARMNPNFLEQNLPGTKPVNGTIPNLDFKTPLGCQRSGDAMEEKKESLLGENLANQDVCHQSS
jgi:hypothetical protein